MTKETLDSCLSRKAEIVAQFQQVLDRQLADFRAGRLSKMYELKEIAAILCIHPVHLSKVIRLETASTNRLLAEALHPYAADIILATKVGGTRGSDQSWLPYAKPAELRASVENNLRELRLEQLPLVHFGKARSSLEEYEAALGTMFALQQDGVARRHRDRFYGPLAPGGRVRSLRRPVAKTASFSEQR